MMTNLLRQKERVGQVVLHKIEKFYCIKANWNATRRSYQIFMWLNLALREQSSKDIKAGIVKSNGIKIKVL